MDPAVQNKVLSIMPQIDVICSDMLGNTTGHRETDHFRSMELLETVFNFARGLPSSRKATVLAKYYRGVDEVAFLTDLRSQSYEVRTLKPDASRKESREMFLLAVPQK
jgi:23S rRNA (uridine2552-2'-O)-methyltransferase